MELNSQQILFLTVAFNVITYLVLVWRNDRKAAKEQGTKDWKFDAMWKEYAEKHDIPLNGEKR